MLAPLFYAMAALLLHHGACLTKCTESKCRVNGPSIRFPFRIIDRQPDHCGYPGFDLSCTEMNETLLKLPSSINLFIKEIDYRSQVILAKDPEDCLPKMLLNFNLSASPFQYDDCSEKLDYSILNCSSTTRILSKEISCLGSVFNYKFYAFDSDLPTDFPSLLSCTKMYEISAPGNTDFQGNSIYLKWSNPVCGFCEANGTSCRWKHNSIETYCFDPSRKIGTILSFCSLLVAPLLLLCLLFRHYIAKMEYQSNLEEFLNDYKAFKPTRYSYADIKRITHHFKDDLGHGAYGTVFKGNLSDEIPVAVKVLNHSVGNGEEFVNEVETMAKIHHVNVVRLIGFCADGFKRALVYEYLPNDSLQKFIFSADAENHFLGWKILQDIANGIAKGIEYLHQGCDQRILHFDIKPHNILLDHNFNPKISDFGLAKLCSKDQSVVSMTTARGTIGYMAPEVFSRNFGKVSYKSDVYSFGMLVLEMVGGRKIVDVGPGNGDQIYFPEWIYNVLEQGEDLRFDIEEEGEAKIAKKLAIVGLMCIQWNPMDRPSMTIVVQMLEGDGENLTMPSNPFSSKVPSRMNISATGKRVRQELEAIKEIE